MNKQDEGGDTVLMEASIKGHHKYVNTLIKSGADVNIQSFYGRPALMFAVKEGYSKCVRECLKAGAQINLVGNDDDGENALTWHLMDESPEVIELLYAAGETIDEAKVQVTDYLKPPELSLKHLCRETIRRHLINIDPHQNLFGWIPQLGLPPSLAIYLMYNMSLDDDDDDVYHLAYLFA